MHPQQYPPQYPQNYPPQAPQGYTPAPTHPQYAPQPQQAPQQYGPGHVAGSANPMPTISGTSEPLPPIAAVRLRGYGAGRLLLVIPKKPQTGTKYSAKKDVPGDPQPEIVCDIVALPDPSNPQPITFGGKARNDGSMEEPDTEIVYVGPHGWLAEGVIISSQFLVNELTRLHEAGKVRVGRLYKDPQYNNWKLSEVADDSAEVAAARTWFGLKQSGQFVNSVPQPIPGVPRQAAPQQQAPAPQGWGAPQQAPVNPWQQAGQQPQPYNAAYPQPSAQPYNPWQQAPQAPVSPAPQGWGAAVPQGQPQQYAPADMNAPTGY